MFNPFQDCTPGSLYEINLFDLVKTSKISLKCLKEARKVFEDRYSHTSSYICFKDLIKKEPIKDKLKNTENDAHEMHPCKIFKNIDSIADFLDNFGDLFATLIVDFEYISIPNSIEIVKRINDKCFALRQLHLKNCHGFNILADLNSDFQSVYSLTFSTHSEYAFGIHPEDKALHELFPNIFILNLLDMKETDWQLFHGNFSKVQSIKVQPTYGDLDETSELHLFEFLHNNSHITCFGIESSNIKLLFELNVILTKLRVLELDGISKNYKNYYCADISFQDVIRFDFESKSVDDIPEKLGLRHIDQLILKIPFEFKDEWNDFMKTQVNSDLSELELSTASLKITQFLEIADNLPNLKYINIECPSFFKAENIASFIERSKKLQSLKLEILMLESERMKFQELLTANWTVKCEPRQLNVQKNFARITIRR